MKPRFRRWRLLVCPSDFITAYCSPDDNAVDFLAVGVGPPAEMGDHAIDLRSRKSRPQNTCRHCSLSCSVSRCGASFLLAVFYFWLFAPAVEFALRTMTLPEHHPIRLRTSTTFPPEFNTGVDVDLQQSDWDTMDNRYVHSRGVLEGCCRLASARTCSAFCFRFASLLLSVLVLAFELDLGVLGCVRFLYIETRVPESWIGTQQLVLRI